MRLFFLLLFLLVLTPVFCSAISVSEEPKENRFLVFKPGLERDFSAYIGNANRIESYIVAGELENYTTLIDDAPNSGARELKMHLKLPGELRPGVYMIFFGGREMPSDSSSGTLSAIASAASVVVVISLHPGEYPQYGITAPDIGLGDSGNITIGVENFGDTAISDAYATIKLYDQSNTLIAELVTDHKTVPTKLDDVTASAELKATFDSSKYKIQPGIYRAEAVLTYDGKQSEQVAVKEFRIGTLHVDVVDWSDEVIVNATNKLVLTLQSDWAGSIEDVYAKIYLSNGKVLKTPNLDIYKFETATLETYWEVYDYELGNVTLKVEVFYAGQSTKKDIVVRVVDGVPPVIEKPSSVNYTNIAVIAVGVVLIILILYLILSKNKGSNEGSSAEPPKL